MTESETLGTVPEPDAATLATERFNSMQEQMATMMALFQEQHADTNSALDDLTAENIVLRDEIKSIAQDGGQIEDTPKKVPQIRLAQSRILPSPLKPSRIGITSTTRRSSAFFNKPDTVQIPKLLNSGDAFKSMVKYGGKPNESIHEHFITFEYHARLQEPCFWCDFLQITVTKTVQQSIIAKGLTLPTGRDSSGKCLAGWCDYTELHEWLVSKYHRDQYQLELLSRLFYSYNQTGSLDAYITLVDTKIASSSMHFPDILKKMLILEKMDAATAAIMTTRPETYN